MIVSAEDLVRAGFCSLEAAELWIDPLNEAMARFEIDTPNRIAHFLAQTTHESGGFKFTVENLNYSAEALLRVFRKYFPSEAMARAYARKPQAIASRVYANRMGNGDEESGDGWRYRGRGLIQLTGRANYAGFSKAANVNAIGEPDLVARPPLAALSAGWFWAHNGLNDLADFGSLETITRRVNGGLNGIEDRRKRYESARGVLGAVA